MFLLLERDGCHAPKTNANKKEKMRRCFGLGRDDWDMLNMLTNKKEKGGYNICFLAGKR